MSSQRSFTRNHHNQMSSLKNVLKISTISILAIQVNFLSYKSSKLTAFCSRITGVNLGAQQGCFISRSANVVQKRDTCNHFICEAKQACRIKTTTGTEASKSSTNPCHTPVLHKASTLSCTPQLQSVVDRARALKPVPDLDESTGYEWKPNRSNLTLSFKRYWADNARETMV